MRNKLKYLSIFVALLSFGTIVNCGDKGKAPEAESKTETPAASAKGQEAFELNCSSCHGKLGAGDGDAAAALNPKPRNFKSPAAEWKNGKTKEGVLKTLKEGIAGSAMVGYPHLEESHEALAEYVLELGK